MEALFTTFPAYGHLLPMLPLAQAAAAAGDEVLVVASEALHGTGDGLAMRALGPSLLDLLAENDRRSGQDVLGYRSVDDARPAGHRPVVAGMARAAHPTRR